MNLVQIGRDSVIWVNPEHIASVQEVVPARHYGERRVTQVGGTKVTLASGAVLGTALSVEEVLNRIARSS